MIELECSCGASILVECTRAKVLCRCGNSNWKARKVRRKGFMPQLLKRLRASNCPLGDKLRELYTLAARRGSVRLANKLLAVLTIPSCDLNLAQALWNEEQPPGG